MIGFCANLMLREPDPVDLAADPVVARARELARRFAPIRPGEAMLYHRFVMDRATYQSEPSPSTRETPSWSGRSGAPTSNRLPLRNWRRSCWDCPSAPTGTT
jgi:hypothetical protein